MIEQQNDTPEAAAVILLGRKAVLARYPGEVMFGPPGGKPIGNQTEAEACILGVEDDLGILVDEKDIKYIGTFVDDTEEKVGRARKIVTYFIKHYSGHIRPYDVEEVVSVGSDIPEGMQVSPIFLNDIVPYLKQSDLID